MSGKLTIDRSNDTKPWFLYPDGQTEKEKDEAMGTGAQRKKRVRSRGRARTSCRPESSKTLSEEKSTASQLRHNAAFGYFQRNDSSAGDRQQAKLENAPSCDREGGWRKQLTRNKTVVYEAATLRKVFQKKIANGGWKTVLKVGERSKDEKVNLSKNSQGAQHRLHTQRCHSPWEQSPLQLERKKKD